MLQKDLHVKKWKFHQEHKLVVKPTTDPVFRTITLWRDKDGKLYVDSPLEKHLREFVE